MELSCKHNSKYSITKRIDCDQLQVNTV